MSTELLDSLTPVARDNPPGVWGSLDEWYLPAAADQDDGRMPNASTCSALWQKGTHCRTDSWRDVFFATAAAMEGDLLW